MKNRIVKVALTSGLLCATILLAGCETIAKKYPYAKSIEIIKLNYAKADSIGTKLSDGTASSRAVTKVTTDKSVVGFDSEGKEISVLSLDAELSIDINTMEPVREVYQCKKDGIPEQAKGIYSVFAAPFTPEYTDGSKAPSVGQIFYTYPAENGKGSKTVDIFNGNVEYKLYTWLKQWQDLEYITFDDSGKIYMNVKKGDESLISIFNPVDKTVKDIELPCGTTDIQISPFAVSGDGTWIFVPVLTDAEVRNGASVIGHSKLYAVNTADSSKSKTLYESLIEFKTEALVNGPVMINDSTVYYGIWECSVDYQGKSGRPSDYRNIQGGDYLVTINSDGTFSTKRNCTIAGYGVLNYFRYLLKLPTDGTIDFSLVTDEMYTEVADYIKSFCGTKSKDEILFSVKNFKGSNAYKEDSEGKPLCDGAAVKYIFAENGYGELTSYAFHNDKIGLSDGNGQAYDMLPINSMFIDKTTGETVESKTDKVYLEKMLAGTGILRVAGNGIWMTGYIYDENDYEVQYKKSIPVHYMDEKGNYVLETPAALKDFTAFAGIYPSDEHLKRTEDDPWFKFTIQTNSKGVAYLSMDKKSIVYYEGNSATTIASITEGEIFGFELDDSTVIYTVKVEESFKTEKAEISNSDSAIELKTDGVLNQAVNIEA